MIRAKVARRAWLAGLTYQEWYGALLPGRAAENVVATLHAAIAVTMQGAPIRNSLARLEMTPLLLEPSAFRQRMLRERDAWGPVVAAAGFDRDD